jgi:hypothetical protein
VTSAADVESAIRLAIEHSGVRFQVFLPTWLEVDQGRAAVDAAGFSDRIGVHHEAARRMFDMRSAA